MTEARMVDAIEAAIARARAKAGPAIANNFTHPAWAMSADEFRGFWGPSRMAAVSTVGTTLSPHIAPIDVTLAGDRFVTPAFPNSVRMADMRKNPRVAIAAWDDAWHAAIVYGLAILDEGSVIVRPTRIYAIRAPRGHPRWRG